MTNHLIYSSVLDIILHILFHISTFIFQHGIYLDTMQNVYHHLTSQYTSQTSKWIVKNEISSHWQPGSFLLPHSLFKSHSATKNELSARCPHTPEEGKPMARIMSKSERGEEKLQLN